MICRSCGKLLDDDAKFCTDCGALVEEPVPETTVPETDSAPVEIKNDPASPDENISGGYEPVELPEPEIPAAPEIPEPPVIPEPEEPAAPVASERPALGSKPAVHAAPPNNQPPFVSQPSVVPPQVSGTPIPDMQELPEAPAQEAATEEPEVRVGAGRLTGAFIVSVLAAVILMVLSLAFSVKLGVSGEIISKRVKGMNIGAVLDSKADGDTTSNNIFNSLKFGEITSGAADKYNFREYMAQTNLLDFAAEKAGAYADFLVNGKGTDPSVSANEITTFFENNDSVAADTFGRALGNTEYRSIHTQLVNNKVEENLSIGEWSRKADFKLASLSYLFSFITLGIFAALVLVLLIWIAVIVDKRGRFLSGFYGNIFLWSGLIVFLVGAAVLGGAAIAHNVTNELAFYLTASAFAPFALFAMATGAFEFVIGFILRKVKKAIVRRQKRDKAVAAAVEKALAQRVN